MPHRDRRRRGFSRDYGREMSPDFGRRFGGDNRFAGSADFDRGDYTREYRGVDTGYYDEYDRPRNDRRGRR